VRQWILIVVIIALLFGLATADRGIDPALETQGLAIQTVVSATGGFSQESDLEWQMTDSLAGLAGIPPLGDGSSEGSIDVIQWDPLMLIAQGQNNGAVYYATVYTEDTNTNGLGQVSYTKNLGIDTGSMTTGQSNVEAIKQLVYVGDTGSKVISNDFISIDGASGPSPSARFGLAVNTDPPAPGPLTSNTFICPFGGSESGGSSFCSHVESSSSIEMNVADVATTTKGRFVVPSADTPVALSHDIHVSDSIGKASAGIDVKVREGGSLSEDIQDFAITMFDPNTGHTYEFTGWVGTFSSELSQETTMHDFTSIDGAIMTFDKSMSYTSGSSL
jgi:hypothetical protein